MGAMVRESYGEGAMVRGLWVGSYGEGAMVRKSYGEGVW